MTRLFGPLSPRLVSRVAAALLVLAPGRTLHAQTAANADTIVLIRKLSGMRFAAGATEAKVFGGVFGLSSQFESLLGTHPVALRAARRVRPYSIVQLVGSLGMAAAGGLALKEALNQADNPLGAKSSTTPLLLMATSGAVTLVGAFGGRHHLSQSVRLFNEAQRSSGRGAAASFLAGARLGAGISALDRSPRVTLGIIMPVP